MDQILTTKLFIPRAHPNLVRRHTLMLQLDESLNRKLSLISAPAGFGKTTLISEWLADRAHPAAWVSLDDGDRDPGRFLIYVVAALKTVFPGLGEGVLEMLQAASPPPNDAILTSLLNEIASIPEKFVLVLDDYHATDSRPVDRALMFVLKHLPPQMHLVIATREDPNLPLAALRAQSQLTELRAADLRFTPAEASIFLNEVMGLDLTPEEVVTLEARTEGWIAGLQLAALSMHGQEDVHGFVKAFAGDNRYIVDYLIEEVLKHQPEPIRRFLLETSILDRLSGPLCDAVQAELVETAQGIAEAPGIGMSLLDTLERNNLFLIPLDDKHEWFRYHHLFADVLRAHLMNECPERIPILHRRAGRWYEQNKLLPDAIRHALAIKDFE